MRILLSLFLGLLLIGCTEKYPPAESLSSKQLMEKIVAQGKVTMPQLRHHAEQKCFRDESLDANCKDRSDDALRPYYQHYYEQWVLNVKQYQQK